MLLLPLSLLLLHSRGACASVVVFPLQDNFGRIRSSLTTGAFFASSSDVQAQQQPQQQRQPPPLQPVVIIDDSGTTTGTAKAATLALQTWQVLTGQVQIPISNHPSGTAKLSSLTPPPPLTPPVYVAGSIAEVQQVNQPVVLHLLIEVTGNAAAATMMVPEMLQPPLFVGLHVHCSSENEDLHNAAHSAGTALQQMLHTVPKKEGTITTCVSLDLELHLALLRMNALPKDPNHAAHGDSYHVLMPDGGSLLMDYQFEYDNPFGGCDPLKCPNTQEMLIETPPTTPSLQRSRHLAAAYTAVRGQENTINNNDATRTTTTFVSPLSAAIIAASVATILGDDDHNSSASIPTTWNMIQRAVQLCSHIRNFGTKSQVPGFMRQKYKEYGHK